MRAEPFICTRGERCGEIDWFGANLDTTWGGIAQDWQRYADFEREKLKELDKKERGISTLTVGINKFDGRSESERFMERVELLKQKCEKEGVEWLPLDQDTHWPCCGLRRDDADSENVDDCTCNPKVEYGGKSLCPGHWYDGKIVMKTGDDADSLKDCGEVEHIKIEPARSCTCGCHNSPPGGCPGCDDDCPQKIERYGNLGPRYGGDIVVKECECLQPKLKSSGGRKIPIMATPTGSDSWFAKHWQEAKNESVDVVENKRRQPGLASAMRREEIAKKIAKDCFCKGEITGDNMTHTPDCCTIHNCDEPVKDHYTKQEIDERMAGIEDFMYLVNAVFREEVGCKQACEAITDFITEFRTRFLK